MDIFNAIASFFKEMFHWWVIVTPWEQCVRVRLGKNLKLLGPGIHLKLPVVDVMHVQPIRLRAISIHDQSLMTLDHKVVALSGSLSYKVVDLLKLYQTLHQPTDTIEQEVMGIVSDYVLKTELSELSAEQLSQVVNDKLDLTEFGLDSGRFFLTSFAIVKTFRLINGDMGTYNDYDIKLRT